MSNHTIATSAAPVRPTLPPHARPRHAGEQAVNQYFETSFQASRDFTFEPHGGVSR
jgi:hypothetical protein